MMVNIGSMCVEGWRSISRRMGDAIGAGLTSRIMAAQQLNQWAPDIIRTTDANYPEYGLYFESRADRRRRRSIRGEKGLLIHLSKK